MKINFDFEKKNNSYTISNKKLGIFIRENSVDDAINKFNNDYNKVYSDLGEDNIKKILKAKIDKKNFNESSNKVEIINNNPLYYFFIKLISIFVVILVFITILVSQIASNFEIKTGSAFWSEFELSIYDLADDIKKNQNPNKEKIIEALKVISEEYKPYFEIINDTFKADSINKD